VSGVPKLIDLNHQSRPQVVGAYLLPGDEPTIVDCGPASGLESLAAGLGAQGLEIGDLRRLLLTHIHLDHAGAAGVLVRSNPDLVVHVSEVGAPHLVDPSRLETSARRLYGDDFDRLWGELAPVPAENVRLVGSRVDEFDCFPTPGHASHHVTYIDPEGGAYVGDVCGVRIAPSSFCSVPTMPPETDLETWYASLDAIEAREPTRFYLTHFGPVNDPVEQLALVRQRLAGWSERVRVGMSQEDFVRMAETELVGAADGRLADSYRRAVPFEHCYLGLERYWRKRREAVG
jgi:glyoxylase-like metal-dependent hydrolase (beta-lactamase superfamily II)